MASWVFWPHKLPHLLLPVVVIFTDLPPPPLCATGDHPGSLAADDLVSGSTGVSASVSTCLPGKWVHLSPVSQPVPRLNGTFVKKMVSKLPTSQGRWRGRQSPEALAITACRELRALIQGSEAKYRFLSRTPLASELVSPGFVRPPALALLKIPG